MGAQNRMATWLPRPICGEPKGKRAPGLPRTQGLGGEPFDRRRASGQVVRRLGSGERRSLFGRIISSPQRDPAPDEISFDARELGAWDNILIEFLAEAGGDRR